MEPEFIQGEYIQEILQRGSDHSPPHVVAGHNIFRHPVWVATLTDRVLQWINILTLLSTVGLTVSSELGWVMKNTAVEMELTYTNYIGSISICVLVLIELMYWILTQYQSAYVHTVHKELYGTSLDGALMSVAFRPWTVFGHVAHSISFGLVYYDSYIVLLCWILLVCILPLAFSYSCGDHSYWWEIRVIFGCAWWGIGLFFEYCEFLKDESYNHLRVLTTWNGPYTFKNETIAYDLFAWITFVMAFGSLFSVFQSTWRLRTVDTEYHAFYDYTMEELSEKRDV